MLKRDIIDLKKTLDDISDKNKKISSIINHLTKCLLLKNKIFICGNGGSASEAEHLSAEFLVRLKPNNNRVPFPLISLTQNTPVTTACSNDYGFEKIFSRPLDALGKNGDTLICLSTSGNSKNILHVLKLAKKRGIKTISFLGGGGGKAKFLSDINLIIKSKNVARIQECHLFLGHYILGKVEDNLIKWKKKY